MMPKPAASAAVLAAILLAAPPLFAQVDFSGSWTLDKEISGDLTHASFEPQQNANRAPRNGGFGGGGFGGRGGFGRGGGMRRPSDGSNDSRGVAALTVDERTRLREIAHFVKTLSTLVIDHTDHSTFTLTDGAGRSRLFPTDGKPAEQAFASTTIDSTTKWDGPHLVTTYRIGPTRDLLFTYILVPATSQMALRITLDESGRQRADVPELRLVYKRKPAAATTPKRD